jgi:glyoxylase-like metal-dependent hydrolase (beta-lactamase superfamily II)
VTHGDIDHVGAIGEFDRIFIHPNDLPLISNYRGTVVPLADGTQFDLGGLTVAAVELFGHTEGSVGFLDSTKRFFTGDAIGARRCLMQPTRLPLEALLGVLRHIEGIAEKWDTIWNGHFGHMNRVVAMRPWSKA